MIKEHIVSEGMCIKEGTHKVEIFSMITFIVKSSSKKCLKKICFTGDIVLVNKNCLNQLKV